MKVLVTGATGLLGAALVPALRRAGYEVFPAIRGQSWIPETGELNTHPPDAVIHLAGENIGSARWTPRQKEQIRASRVLPTRRLCDRLAGGPTSVFMSASAVGIYGNRGDEVLTEESDSGGDFLAEVARSWEGASAGLSAAGVRVIHLRFGMILSAAGGALRKMLPIFRMGLGGRLGSGRQWVSWISRRDAVAAILFLLQQPQASGAFNLVAPEPAQNADYTRALAGALRRPSILPVPAFALRIAFGEMADSLLLASQRAVPKRLMQMGFRFHDSTMGEGFSGALREK